jgi:hypothetical protein
LSKENRDLMPQTSFEAKVAETTRTIPDPEERSYMVDAFSH